MQEKGHRMDNTELFKAISTLTGYQRDKVIELVQVYMTLNMEISQMVPERCPRCGKADAKFVKNGFVNGKQRYRCKECGSKFVYDRGRITSHSHQGEDKWSKAIEDTLALSSIDEMARNIGVCHTTAFYMRHKILMCMEKAVQEMPELDGLIEADETFLLESEKGKKVEGRKPRKHGEKAGKRGLSDEQICICVAADRNGNITAKSVNRAKPSGEDIRNALQDKIAEEAVFQCDGSDSYNELIFEKNCKKFELNGHKSYDKVHHLNTVNGLHSRIKDMNRKYRGVSTKYLNRYLAMFTLREVYSGESIEEMSDKIRKQLDEIPMDIQINDLLSTNLLDL